MLNTYQKQNLILQLSKLQALLYNLQLVLYQYVLVLVKFTVSDRKQGCVWLYFDMTKVVGKAVCVALCNKCSKEMQGFVARI